MQVLASVLPIGSLAVNGLDLTGHAIEREIVRDDDEFHGSRGEKFPEDPLRKKVWETSAFPVSEPGQQPH